MTYNLEKKMVEENDKLTTNSTHEESKASGDAINNVDASNNTENVKQAQNFRESNQSEIDNAPRSSVSFSISLLHKKIQEASKGYEEILRIVHSTNLRNAVLVKKNFYEIELICKNALLELKGL